MLASMGSRSYSDIKHSLPNLYLDAPRPAAPGRRAQGYVPSLSAGRVLAVEYKGKHLYDAADADEKRAVGAVWQSRSGGKCLFVMPTEGDFSVIAKGIKQG
jgi:hypothetical protein